MPEETTSAGTPPAAAPVVYNDEDLVYVDPENRVVVGIVEWSNSGKPKPKAMPERPAEPGRERRIRTRYYPWGTYRSMKRIYKLEGKIRSEPPSLTLDQAIELALKEPYWDLPQAPKQEA